MTIAASIRAARADDAELLPAIERSSGEAFRGMTDLGWIADDDVMSVEQHAPLIVAGNVWVAEIDGRVVGFITAEATPDALHIWQMAVEHSAQGHGFGRALLNTVIENARVRGARAVTLSTFRDIPWNAPFYAKSGFRILHEQDLNERLRDVLENEVAHALPREQRCAMRLDL